MCGLVTSPAWSCLQAQPSEHSKTPVLPPHGHSPVDLSPWVLVHDLLTSWRGRTIRDHPCSCKQPITGSPTLPRPITGSPPLLLLHCLPREEGSEIQPPIGIRRLLHLVLESTGCGMQTFSEETAQSATSTRPPARVPKPPGNGPSLHHQGSLCLLSNSTEVNSNCACLVTGLFRQHHASTMLYAGLAEVHTRDTKPGVTVEIHPDKTVSLAVEHTPFPSWHTQCTAQGLWHSHTGCSHHHLHLQSFLTPHSNLPIQHGLPPSSPRPPVPCLCGAG